MLESIITMIKECQESRISEESLVEWARQKSEMILESGKASIKEIEVIPILTLLYAKEWDGKSYHLQIDDALQIISGEKYYYYSFLVCLPVTKCSTLEALFCSWEEYCNGCYFSDEVFDMIYEIHERVISTAPKTLFDLVYRQLFDLLESLPGCESSESSLGFIDFSAQTYHQQSILPIYCKSTINRLFLALREEAFIKVSVQYSDNNISLNILI